MACLALPLVIPGAHGRGITFWEETRISVGYKHRLGGLQCNAMSTILLKYLRMMEGNIHERED